MSVEYKAVECMIRKNMYLEYKVMVQVYKRMSVEYKVVDCMVRKSMYLEYKVMVPSIQGNVRRIQSYGPKNSNLSCMVYAVFNPQIQS